MSMAAEREIKTVLTLDDASFSRGLKAATSNVAAIRAEMNASIKKADGLGKGFKKWSASVSGLNKVLKAERQQMKVLNKEYQTQKKALAEAVKEMEKARKEHGEDSEEVKKASNAYAALAAKVNELRKQMALLEQQEEDDEEQLKEKVESPLKKVGQTLGAVAIGFTTLAVTAGAALIKLSGQAQESANELKQNLAANEVEFGVWSKLLQQEADNAWKNLGLSKSAYLAAANDIGAFLQEAGAPVQQSAEISAQVLEMAASLSSQYGVPIETVLNDIKDAANGSRTAMNRYGIQVTGTTVQQTALKYGVTKTYEEMTEEEKKLWAVKTALEQGKEAQKDYTTETNNTTDASKKLTAAWENFLSGAGSAEDVGKAAGNLVSTWAEKITSGGPKMMKSAIDMAGTFLKSFLLSFSATWSSKIWPEIQKFFKATFGVDVPDWNTVVTTVQTWWDTNVKPAINFVANYFVAAGKTVQEAVAAVSGWWNDVATWISNNEALQAVFSVIGETWRSAVATVRAWWADVSPKIQEQGILKTLFHAVGDTWANVSTAVSTWWSGIEKSIQENGLLTTIFHVVGDAWGKVSETVTGWWSTISTKIQNNKLIQAAVQAVGDTWQNVKSTVSSWWSGISASIQENGLLNTMFHIFGDAWAGVKDTVSTWWGTISEKIKNEKILQAAVQAVGDAWNNVKTAVSTWWDNDVAPKIEKDGLLTTLFYVAGDAWGKVKETVSTWWDTTKTKIQNNKMLQTVFKTVGDAWENVKTTVSSWWTNDINPKIQENGGLLQTIFHVAGDAWAGVKGTVSTWWSTISAKIQNNKLLQTIFTAVGQDWENIKSGIDAWWNGENGVKAKIAQDGLFKTVFGIDAPKLSDVLNTLGEWWKEVKSTFTGIFSTKFAITIPSWNEIVTEWNTFWSNAYDNLPGWMKDILNFFGLGGGGSTVTAGSTALNEAANKLASSVTSASSSISDLASATTEAASTIRGIKLPENGVQKIVNGMGNAGGAWNVPFDNYLAALHRGEMVLTADQARRYRAQAASGGNTYNDSASIYIDKYNQYSGADADALLQQMQMMQRRQRMGYGLA